MRRYLRFGAALAALSLMSGLGACGGDDSSDAERELAKSIAGKTGAEVKFVECPDGAKTGKGQAFNCTALVPVTVTQIEENGEARWQITSLTGPPGEAKGSTGATGPSGTTGATEPTGTDEPAAISFGNLVPYRNEQAGYRLLRPRLWSEGGSGGDVTFASGPYFVHVISGIGRLQPVSQFRSGVRADKRLVRIEDARRVRVSRRSANRIRFVLKPNSGAEQHILRFQFARGGKRVGIDFASPSAGGAPGYTAVQRRMVASFRFL